MLNDEIEKQNQFERFSKEKNSNQKNNDQI
jgi:hypothetical protein